jgi:hypothetical protein
VFIRRAVRNMPLLLAFSALSFRGAPHVACHLSRTSLLVARPRPASVGPTSIAAAYRIAVPAVRISILQSGEKFE